MTGTSHADIGTTSGVIVANYFSATPSATLLFMGLRLISGLIPDLDIDGKLSGRITISHKIIRSIAQLIGVLLITYSFYGGSDEERTIGIGIGLGMIILSSLIKQKHMLLITGIGVVTGGYFLDEIWLFLLGIYIFISAWVPHRSYTHSIIGLIFFGIIAFHLEAALDMKGIYYTCIIGYISHLVADSKLLPFNKRGIPLFLPVSTKEI